ncbi:MAG: hypothetical protein ACRD16_08325 [Thermoanaerobaculia bacterium]
MELDDLKSQWAEYGRKLDANIRLNERVLRESRVGKADSSLKWAFRGILFEQLMSIPAVILLGIFISDHFSDPRYLLPAAVLDLFAIFSIASCGYQMGELKAVDYGQPVVAIQRKLAKVRVLRLATIKWAFLLWPVLWIPFAIVTFKGILGIDGYVLFRGDWLAIDLSVGVAITLLLAWASLRFGARARRLPLARPILDALAGRSLSEAMAFLERLTQFEKETVERNGIEPSKS